jgi:hypothetical protein
MSSVLNGHWDMHTIRSWFVPPIVIPPALMLLIVLYAVFRAH